MDKLNQRGLFVTGTDTGVGKTHISAILAHLLNQRDLVVRPRKPVESGCVRGEEGLLPADAATLKAAAGAMSCWHEFALTGMNRLSPRKELLL